MRICREERHLTLCVAPISAMCIGLNEFADSEAIRGFFGRDRNVFAHNLVSLVLVAIYTLGESLPAEPLFSLGHCFSFHL
jgi:hypothetical protein